MIDKKIEYYDFVNSLDKSQPLFLEASIEKELQEIKNNNELRRRSHVRILSQSQIKYPSARARCSIFRKNGKDRISNPGVGVFYVFRNLIEGICVNLNY